MLTICRTSSVRARVPVLLKAIHRHLAPIKRTLNVFSNPSQDKHVFTTQATSHQNTSTLLTSTANEQPIHDIKNPTPIQYAPDSPPPTSYQIPAATLLDAEAKGTFWSYTMYKHMTTGKPPLRHYCKTREQTETVAKMFIQDGAKHLGFDMEWAPPGRPYLNEGARVKANVSMIQLASESRIAIFHLALHPETTALTLLPPTSSLAHLLTNPLITKLGVAISADMTRLKRYFPHLTPRSHFELSHLYKTILYPDNHSLYNKRLVSLQEQTQAIFQLPLSKDQDIRGSDWSRKVGMEQVEYAASDAYVGVMLFEEMDRRRKEMLPVPSMPAFVEYRAALGEWPGEKKVRPRKQVEIVAGEADGKEVIEEDEEADEEEVEMVVHKEHQQQQHSSKTLDAEGMEEEDFTDAGDDAFHTEDMVGEKSKTSTVQRAKKSTPPMVKSTAKIERTPEEKAAALARRNVWIQTMYQQKLKK